MPQRIYVAELTDPVTDDLIILEAATEDELDAKIDAAIPDADPADEPDTPADTQVTA